MITDAIFQILSTDPGVNAIVGTPATRSDKSFGIFPGVAPDSTRIPYIVFSQYSGAPVISYAGTNRLQKAGFQFSCYAASFRTAKLVAYAVKQALQGFLGIVAAGSPAISYNIQGAWLANERDLPEPILHATLYNTQVDFEFDFVDLQ